MKYVVFDKYTTKWEMVYCTLAEKCETQDELLKAISDARLCQNFEIFNAKEHICANGGGIKNDGKMFSAMENDGVTYIWQLGSKVSDITNFIIPNLYYVRKVGILIY